MRGYGRSDVPFRWFNWWSPMLIAQEEDDAATLAAEDEAIRAQEAGELPDDGTFLLPDSLAHLVTSDDGSVHEGAQGTGGRPG